MIYKMAVVMPILDRFSTNNMIIHIYRITILHVQDGCSDGHIGCYVLNQCQLGPIKHHNNF